MANSNFKVRTGLTIGDSISISDAGSATGITNFTSANNSDITIAPNGTGDIYLSADTVYVGDANSAALITTNGAGTLTINPGDRSGTDLTGYNTTIKAGNGTGTGGSGSIVFQTAPVGSTGSSANTLVDRLTINKLGNVVVTRNYVLGAVRDSTTENAGYVYSLTNGTGIKWRGLTIDNKDDNSNAVAYVARTYNSTNSQRPRMIFERARGTTASPSALQSGDYIYSVDANGYTSTGWISDLVSGTPSFFGFQTSENWVSTTNVGTTFSVATMPSATTFTGGASTIATVVSNPQFLQLRGDNFSIGRAKTSGFTATGCSLSGTTLTIGTVTSGSVAVGQIIQSSTPSITNTTYIVSGSGSTWTINQSSGTQSGLTITGYAGYIAGLGASSVDTLADLRLITNNIKSSTGTTQITTSASAATLALRGDTISLKDAGGTDQLVLSSSSATFTQPVSFPVKTATQWNAITGSVGQQVCVSDSGGGSNPNGMMAFWDTTNTRWSYIHDNSAV